MTKALDPLLYRTPLLYRDKRVPHYTIQRVESVTTDSHPLMSESPLVRLSSYMS